MPRKNGAECLNEIKLNNKFKKLSIIIYSTFVNGDMAGLLYNAGAHYYMKKVVLTELEIAMKQILNAIHDKKFMRPSKDKFLLHTISAT